MNKLKIELWYHEDNGVPWPKLITFPDGEFVLPPWNDSLDLRQWLEPYIGELIEVITFVGQGPKTVRTEKLIKVEKIDFETE